MLILSNDDVAELLTMEDCLQALSTAYQAYGEGRALNIPRLDSLLEHHPEQGSVYSFKVMGGAVIGGVQALRINSDVIHWPEIDGNRRRVKIPAAKGHWVGLVYLFDPASGMPLAIFPDGVLQHFRVGAANGLAARYLAPAGVQQVALLGTGWQAQTQLLALDAVVKPREVRVFSPNPAHREAFCARMQGSVQAALRPVADADAAVRGAQVVAAATNSMQPVLRPEWIQPGIHFSTIKAQEVDLTMVLQTSLYLHTR
ncbi:MAG: hypothetical protein K6T31_02400, partial [Alicyclobacillus sp.]|nr:hypothetical protein [Alicyclobacillus sp.]